MNSVTPSAGQLKVISEVTNWYNQDTSQFLILTGAGGTGKTTLLGHVNRALKASGEMLFDAAIDKAAAAKFLINIHVTATQNDPVSNLIDKGFTNASTIYTYLRLQVKPNHQGGYEVTPAYDHTERMQDIRHYENTLLVVDEVSHLDEYVFEKIRETRLRCIFMGDAAQLLSISKTPFSVFDAKHNIKTIELTENFRAQSPALRAANESLHQAVMRGLESRVDHNGEDIIICDDREFKEAIKQHAREATDKDAFKILTYKKALSVKYNNYVRRALELPHHPVHGDILVVNERYSRNVGTRVYLRPSERIRYLSLKNDSAASSTWEPYSSEDTHGEDDRDMYDGSGMPLHIHEKLVHFMFSTTESELNIDAKTGVTLKNSEHRADILRELKSKALADVKFNASLSPVERHRKVPKPWELFYSFKESVLDYRFSYAENTHKAQGRTYPVVFIDLPDLFTAGIPDTIRRLVYVAFSRASQKVYIRRPN